MCSSLCLFWRPAGRMRHKHGVREGHSCRRQGGDAGFEFVQRMPGVRWPAQDGTCARDAGLELVQRRPGVKMGIARGMQISSWCSEGRE